MNSDIEHREGGEPYVHSSVVGAPNVTMSITDRNGNGIQAAQVGDPLSLRFEIQEKSSKYPHVHTHTPFFEPVIPLHGMLQCNSVQQEHQCRQQISSFTLKGLRLLTIETSLPSSIPFMRSIAFFPNVTHTLMEGKKEGAELMPGERERERRRVISVIFPDFIPNASSHTLFSQPLAHTDAWRSVLRQDGGEKVLR